MDYKTIPDQYTKQPIERNDDVVPDPPMRGRIDDDKRYNGGKLNLWYNGFKLDGDIFWTERTLADVLKDQPHSNEPIPGVVDGTTTLQPLEQRDLDILEELLHPTLECPILPDHCADLLKDAIVAARQQNRKPVRILMSETLAAGLWKEMRHMLIGDNRDIQVTGMEGKFWGVPFKQTDVPDGLLGLLETDAQIVIEIRE